MSVIITLQGVAGYEKDIKPKIAQAEEAISYNIEREAKLAFTSFPKPPIKTGYLRNNTKAQKTGEKWQVVASTPLKPSKKGVKAIEYAKFVEYGTYKMPARPFMQKGIKNSMPENEKIIKKIFS